MKILLSSAIALVFSLCMTLPAFAEEGGTTWDHMKQDMNQAGKNIGKIGKKAGETLEEGGKSVGSAMKKVFSGSKDKGQGKGKDQESK